MTVLAHEDELEIEQQIEIDRRERAIDDIADVLTAAGNQGWPAKAEKWRRVTLHDAFDNQEVAEVVLAAVAYSIVEKDGDQTFRFGHIKDQVRKAVRNWLDSHGQDWVERRIHDMMIEESDD